MRSVISVGLLTAFLSGCGYKGPLYVPAPGADAKNPGGIAAPETAPERPVPAQSVPAPK